MLQFNRIHRFLGFRCDLLGRGRDVTVKKNGKNRKPIKYVLTAILTAGLVVFSLLLASCGLFEETPETESMTETESQNIVFESPTDGLYSYEDMKSDMLALSEKYNGIFTSRSIGTSADGRDIMLGILGNENASRRIIVTAAMHGREYLNSYVVMLQIEEALASYYTASFDGTAYSDLFDAVAIYILPMCNPDGVSISQYGIDAVRDPSLRAEIERIYESDKGYGFTSSPLNKYLSYWKANAQGVDINRNFDSDWQKYVGMGVPCFMDYKGKSPVSAPETKALVDLVNQPVTTLASVCIHSSGSIIYQNDPALAQLMKNLTDYTVSGDKGNLPSFSEWCYYTLGIPAVTIETGSGYCPFSFDKYVGIYDDINLILPTLAAFYQ